MMTETGTVANVEQDKADNEKAAIIEKLKAKAQKDWPLDFSTQQFWYNEQLDAQERMK